MACGGQSIQRVVAKRLGASPVRQLSAIPHPVVQIIRLVDLAIRRGELMEDGGDL